MIHIEGDWYIRQDGYKNYALGRTYSYKSKGEDIEVLTDCTYHSSLIEALRAYTEISVSNLLKDKELELLDALRMVTDEYKRLSALYEKVLSAPLD